MNIYKKLGINSIGEYKSYLIEHKKEIKSEFKKKYSVEDENLTGTLIKGTVVAGGFSMLSMYAFSIAVYYHIPIADSILLVVTYGFIGTMMLLGGIVGAMDVINSLRASDHYKRLLDIVMTYDNNPEVFISHSAYDLEAERSK